MALDSGKKGGGLEQLDKKLDQKLRLNPKASEFKPIGLRSQAPAFVPRGTEEEEQLLNAHFKEHFNVIFIGHVDAGKSTLGGNILFLTGMVDKRTMEKYEREAKDAGRESWYLSWALDTNSEERAKGKTVECGRAFFETEKRRYTILDAPGHKNFVPSMLGGAAQADVGVLVISARRGEFETGFDRGGQTREHAILAKTSGVRQLIVVINKMDDPTVQWDQGRYADILAKLTPFLRTAGYNPKTDLIFLPVSGYTGANVKDRLAAGVAPWYSGPSLLEVLDGLTAVDRKVNAPLRMPISDKFKDMGTVVGGKIESGFVKIGQKLVIMPNKRNCEVSAIFGEDDGEIESAICGDNVRIRLRGVEEEDVSLGNVLSDPKNPCSTAVHFDAQLFILDAKNIIAPGYTSVLHVHNLVEEVSIVRFLHLLDKKNPNKKSRVPPTFVKRGQSCIATLTSSANADAFISNSTSTSASAPSSAPSSNSTSANSTGVICVERFKDYPQLGRFTLRDEGKTIAIGKIIKLH
ncbi:Eukaryotic peptide chain release factor GTP-binding subunit [Zancudomyces culisetae]|uniref:Eukaryotic peptide chain release factor GTP-binding subunit n=1 Tax=Zancudomyces culisetae TaxID=1213189 RepID=A0A1R1PNL0_ZANCU|nr:Eukaryotic peptide chain release factor GTP-binding subunit [Zancudomyces culisetae]|eukprot:OMH82555.1 Eukaryotic peptide chain release factor GTP-binding subunit [Zancudomyces culisetae]